VMMVADDLITHLDEAKIDQLFSDVKAKDSVSVGEQ